jgi:hypothetical protein
MRNLLIKVLEYLAAHYNPVLDMTFDWMEVKEK